MHPVEEYQNIITLTVDGLNDCEIVTLAGRRVDVKLLYNPGEDRKSGSWGSDELERRCWNENMFQRGWAPRPPVEQPRRTGKKHSYGHRSGGQYIAVLFGLQLPLKHNPFKESERTVSLVFIVSLCSICICVCIVVMAIQQKDKGRNYRKQKKVRNLLMIII